MTASDYSHMPGAAALFDCGHYLGSVAFTVDFGGQATVGLSVEELPAMSFVAARGPKLLFWGDEVADGIGNVTVGNAGANAISGDVYTLSGVKVRSDATSLDGLGKGIYIVNGKKYVVK